MLLWFFTSDLERSTFLAPTRDECSTAAGPLSRIFARGEELLNIPDIAHSAAILSDDIVTLGMVCVSYLDRIGVLEKVMPFMAGVANKAQRMQDGKAPRGAQPVQSESPNGPPVPGLFEQYRPD